MGKSLRLLTAAAVILPVAVVLVGSSGPAMAATSGGGWKFAPTINAPWAQDGGDDEGLDSPLAAVGLCRSAPFNTIGAYAPTGDIDAIVGDPVNNSGASNLGCQTPQNETTIAVDPTNPNHLVAGANDYRVCCDFTALNDGTGWAYVS